MKKYDEFGRPIYETAEEYNQAHRSAQHMHTYETLNDCKDMHKTASQRYENQNGLKKSMTLAGLGVGLFIAMIIVIIGLMSNMSNDSDSYWEEEEGVAEYYGDDSIPLPEDFATFSLDGQTYTLPTYFETIQTLGYSMRMGFDEDDLLPPGFDDSIDLYDADESLIAIVGIQNITDEEIPLGKCTVNYFYITFGADGFLPDFVFGDGFTFESSYEELEAYFGEPYYHYEDHTEEGYYYDSYEWSYYGENETHFINVVFWNGEISDVSIQKTVWDEE